MLFSNAFVYILQIFRYLRGKCLTSIFDTADIVKSKDIYSMATFVQLIFHNYILQEEPMQNKCSLVKHGPPFIPALRSHFVSKEAQDGDFSAGQLKVFIKERLSPN